ncbi:MAG: JAB domain-containing protein, partial [Flavobacteriales bacterium]
MGEEGPVHMPREKLLLAGPQALSAVELIAVLLGSGVQGHSVHQAARALLELVQGDLAVLSSIPPMGMTEVPGIGRAKALQLSAALELGRRRQQMTVQPQDVFIRSSCDVFKRFSIRLSDLGHEEFWLVLLRRSNAVMAEVMVSKGGLTGTVADPKLIFSKALAMRAAGIIAVHNHPSGNVRPSRSDRELTKNLQWAGKML